MINASYDGPPGPENDTADDYYAQFKDPGPTKQCLETWWQGLSYDERRELRLRAALEAGMNRYAEMYEQLGLGNAAESVWLQQAEAALTETHPPRGGFASEQQE